MSVERHGGEVMIRRAEVDDIDAVGGLLERASAWLRSKVVDQWPERFSIDWIGPAIQCGQTWVAERGGQTVGTMTFSRSDPAWPDDTGDALYVHRLAVERSEAGLGRSLLSWASAHASAQGCRFLRLDCLSSNERLCRYYRDAGFRRRGDAEVHGMTVVPLRVGG